MWNHLKAKHEHKLAEKKKSVHVKLSMPKQAMITAFAKESAIFSKDKKLAAYLSAAEVTMHLIV